MDISDTTKLVQTVGAFGNLYDAEKRARQAAEARIAELEGRVAELAGAIRKALDDAAPVAGDEFAISGATIEVLGTALASSGAEAAAVLRAAVNLRNEVIESGPDQHEKTLAVCDAVDAYLAKRGRT